MAKSKKRKPKQQAKAPSSEDFAVIFAKQHGMSPEQARKLIKQHGPQRAEAIAMENRLSIKPSRW